MISYPPSKLIQMICSIHDIALYDVPAVIDHILHVTHQPALYYVGFSWGNQMFYISMSLKPEYNSKVRLMVALGPSAYQHDSPSGSDFFAPVIQRFVVKVYLYMYSKQYPSTMPIKKGFTCLISGMEYFTVFFYYLLT